MDDDADEVIDVIQDDAEDAGPAEVEAEAGPRPPYWVGFFTWLSVALVALVALQLVGVVLQTAALADEIEGLGFSDRLGYAFLQNLDQAPLGFELIVAVVIVLLPVVIGQPTTKRQDAAAQIVLVGVAGLALLITIGGIVGVPARYNIIEFFEREVTPVVSPVLFTHIVRNVATAALAVVAALVGVRVRFAPRRTLDEPAPTQ